MTSCPNSPSGHWWTQDGPDTVACDRCPATGRVELDPEYCTRQAPHICRVNGPCNGLPNPQENT